MNGLSGSTIERRQPDPNLPLEAFVERSDQLVNRKEQVMVLTGSYNYTSFEVEDRELTRLKLQARVARGIEVKGLSDHGLKDGMSVLDVGCGPGFITQIIAEICPSGDVLGIDIDEGLLRIARRELDRSQFPNLSFCEADIHHLEALGRTFDFIYGRFVFQHLADPGGAVRQIYKVLKPGGRLFAIDVDDAWLSLYPEVETFETIRRLQRAHQRRVGGDGHIGRKLFHLFRQAGFCDLKVEAVTLTSVNMGMESFLELTTGYRILFLNERTDEVVTREMVEQMKKDCSDGNHLGCIAILGTSGCRP